jgi:hypothetical protein
MWSRDNRAAAAAAAAAASMFPVGIEWRRAGYTA